MLRGRENGTIQACLLLLKASFYSAIFFFFFFLSFFFIFYWDQGERQGGEKDVEERDDTDSPTLVFSIVLVRNSCDSWPLSTCPFSFASA